jgi:exosome complex component RRP4
MEKEKEKREIVIPGMLIGTMKDGNPGRGTFREGDEIYSSKLGIKEERSGYINVIPLSGAYDPNPGDSVIGIIEEVGMSSWRVDINSPYLATLHVSEVPWEVEFGETQNYLNYRDVIIAKILFVNEIKEVQLTMMDKNLKKIEGGNIITIQPSKVPRIIGKNGSMVSLLRRYTGCWIFISQNGLVWAKGEVEGIKCLTEAIEKIEKEAHSFGLTDRMDEWLKEKEVIK